MLIAIRDYRPFDYVSENFENLKETWQTPADGWRKTAQKVCTLTFQVLSFLPALLLDLIYLPLEFFYQRFCSSPSSTMISEQPSVPSLDRFNALVLLADPYEFYLDRQPNTNAEFLKDALKIGRSTIPPELEDTVRQMIVNQGPPDQGEAPFELFQWSAACFLIHSLRCRTVAQPIRDFLLNGCIEPILRSFDRLANNGKALVMQQVLSPTVQLDLQRRERELVQAIRAKAQEMTQDRSFTQLFTALGNI